MIIPILLLAQFIGINGQTIPSSPHKPKACPVYQHEYYVPTHMEYCDAGSNTALCQFQMPETDICVDDMHEITERDWQALMDRITKLEHPDPAGNHWVAK